MVASFEFTIFPTYFQLSHVQLHTYEKRHRRIPHVFHSIHDASKPNHNSKKKLIRTDIAMRALAATTRDEWVWNVNFLYCFWGKQLNNKNISSIAKYVLFRWTFSNDSSAWQEWMVNGNGDRVRYES